MDSYEALMAAMRELDADPCARLGHACRCSLPEPEIQRLVDQHEAQHKQAWRDFRELFGLAG